MKSTQIACEVVTACKQLTCLFLLSLLCTLIILLINFGFESSIIKKIIVLVIIVYHLRAFPIVSLQYCMILIRS